MATIIVEPTTEGKSFCKMLDDSPLPTWIQEKVNSGISYPEMTEYIQGKGWRKVSVSIQSPQTWLCDLKQ